MKSKIKPEDFPIYKEQLKNQMIDGLLYYVRDGIHPQYDRRSFLDCYNIVQKLGNNDETSELLFKYHNEVIEQAATECYEKTKDLSGFEFIDAFIIYTERLNFLILNMEKVFEFLSVYYLVYAKEKKSLSEFAMDIYKKCFFDKLQTKLFGLLKELINNGQNNENIGNKIKSILKIINYLDFVRPKIVKNNKNLGDWIETSELSNSNPNTYQKMWNDFKG